MWRVYEGRGGVFAHSVGCNLLRIAAGAYRHDTALLHDPSQTHLCHRCIVAFRNRQRLRIFEGASAHRLICFIDDVLLLTVLNSLVVVLQLAR